MFGQGRQEAASWRQALAVFLVALAAALSGLFAVPPLDRDESRFAQATVQMLETGDLVSIRYQELERNKKPVGIHWLQAASVSVFSSAEARAIWAYRLPSLLGVSLAAVFTYLAGCTLFGRRAALFGAVLLAAAPVVAAEGSIAKADGVLLACVTGMQAALARLYLAAPGHRPLLPALAFWAALSAGILVKGPIAPMIAIFTPAVLIAGAPGRAIKAEAKRLFFASRHLLGVPLLLLLVLPWFIAIGIETEGRFFTEAVGIDMLGKIGEAQEEHDGAPGTHALLLFVMFWPAGLFLPAALRWAAPRWREGAVLFCLGWALPVWAVLELAGTKLPHYTMPLYPALALLTGAYLAGSEAPRHQGFRIAGAAVFLLIGIAAVIAAPMLTLAFGGKAGILSYLLSGLVLVLATAAAVLFLKGRAQAPLFLACAAGVLLAWALFQNTLPRLQTLAISPRLSALLDENGAHPRIDGAPPVALVGYHEPSAVFLLGTDTRLTDAQGAAAWLAGGTGRTAAIDSRHLAEFDRAAGRLAREGLGVIEGLNYSDGDEVRLVILRSIEG
jgi:4-amino-4-deoxy-L-arabinose transferase-like glycosyltransferase